MSSGQDPLDCGRVSKRIEDLRPWRASLLVPRNVFGPPHSIEGLTTRLSQVDKAVGSLQNSFVQLRSEVGAVTTTFRCSGASGSNTITPSQSWGARPGSSRELCADASAASTCESRTDADTADNSARLSALEAMYQDLRNGLDCLQERISLPEAVEQLARKEVTDRLEQFRAELDEKLKHIVPANAGTMQQDQDEATPLDAAKQESFTAPGVENLSETVTSVYVILRTEVMQEVGQLPTIVENEVQSLRGQLQLESAKVEQNIIALLGFEAERTELSQRMAEIDRDFAKLQKIGTTYEVEVSELRSRLEVVVRECDKHVLRDQSCRAKESLAFVLASSSEEKGLSDRVRSLESACQQAMAMPSVGLEATESLRAELRQVVDPLRADMDCLKHALDASSQQHDPCRCSNLHNVASLHKRLMDLESAYAAESKKLVEFEQQRGTVEHGLSQDMQNTWAIVNGQVALITQSVEFLQKQYVAVQERLSDIADSVQTCKFEKLCAKGVGMPVQLQRRLQQQQECEQQQERHQTPHKERESISGNLECNIRTHGVPVQDVNATSMSESCPAVMVTSWPSEDRETRLEKAVAKLDELSNEIRAEGVRQANLAEEWASAAQATLKSDLNSVRELVAGTVMKRIASLEVMMSQRMGSTQSSAAKLREARPINETASRTTRIEANIAPRRSPIFSTSKSVVIHGNAEQVATPSITSRAENFDRHMCNNAHERTHGSTKLLKGNSCVAPPMSQLQATPVSRKNCPTMPLQTACRARSLPRDSQPKPFVLATRRLPTAR